MFHNFRKEIKEGGEILLKKLQEYKPKIAAFNGKGKQSYVFCGIVLVNETLYYMILIDNQLLLVSQFRISKYSFCITFSSSVL